MHRQDDVSPQRDEPSSPPVSEHHFSPGVKVVEVRRSGQATKQDAQAPPPSAGSSPVAPATPAP